MTPPPSTNASEASSTTLLTEHSCVSLNSPGPSGSTNDKQAKAEDAQPPSSSSSEPKRKIQKMPLLRFVVGGYAARNLLPEPILPRPLNPVYVECEDVEDIPLAWYGVVWQGGVLLEYAKKHGWAVRSRKWKSGAFDIVPTWDKLRRHYYAEYGIVLGIRDVWGEGADGIEKIVSFYNNREMPGLSKKQRYAVFDTLTEMGYKPGDALWYLDRREHL